jgi:hypothetical protein
MCPWITLGLRIAGAMVVYPHLGGQAMDTNLLPHALVLMSAALVLARMTQAVHASRRRNRQPEATLAERAPRASARRQLSSCLRQGSRLKGSPAYPKQRLPVVRLQPTEPQQLVLGVIAPDYIICGIQPRRGSGSGPPESSKLKSRAGNVWGDTSPVE